MLELSSRSELEGVSAPFIVDALVREEGLDAAWNWLTDRRCSDDPRVSQYLVGLAGLAQESTTRRALESLEKLSGPQDLLSIECAYNLGVYYARVGNVGAAKSKFSVTSSNPQLFELAKAYLLRL